MRLRLIDRVRRYIRPGPRGSRSRGPARTGSSGMGSAPSPSGAGRHRRDYGYRPATPVDTAPPSSFGHSSAEPPAAGLDSTGGKPPNCPGGCRIALDRMARPAGWPVRAGGRSAGRWPARCRPARCRYRAGGGRAGPGQVGRCRAGPGGHPAHPGQAARRTAAKPRRPGRPGPSAGPNQTRPRLPWYEVAHARRAAEGLANCGPLEQVLHREWPASVVPPPRWSARSTGWPGCRR